MSGWRDILETPVKNEEEFVRFLNLAGFCAWKPLAKGDFPNLSEAMGTSNAMFETWFWKDDLHIAKRLHYGKWLGGNAAFCSMEWLPILITAKGARDPRYLFDRGLLSDSSIQVYETLQKHRELPTRDLRRLSRLVSRESKGSYDRAILELSGLFQITKIGLTGRTRGTYSYIWGLMEDWSPESLDEADRFSSADAFNRIDDQLERLGVRLTPRLRERLFGG